MIKCVLITSDGEIQQVVLGKTKIGVVCPYFDGKNEFHVNAWVASEKLKNNIRLHNIHRNMIMVCHEDGFHLNRPFNLIASILSGLRCLGDILFYYTEESEDDGVEHFDLDIKDVEEMLRIIQTE